jgi:hypothetical protein
MIVQTYHNLRTRLFPTGCNARTTECELIANPTVHIRESRTLSSGENEYR